MVITHRQMSHKNNDWGDYSIEDLDGNTHYWWEDSYKTTLGRACRFIENFKAAGSVEALQYFESVPYGEEAQA